MKLSEPLKEMPTEGQFIAIWEYCGVIWSYTLKIDDEGRILYYDRNDDYWSLRIGNEREDIVYFKLEN